MNEAPAGWKWAGNSLYREEGGCVVLEGDGYWHAYFPNARPLLNDSILRASVPAYFVTAQDAVRAYEAKVSTPTAEFTVAEALAVLHPDFAKGQRCGGKSCERCTFVLAGVAVVRGVRVRNAPCGSRICRLCAYEIVSAALGAT